MNPMLKQLMAIRDNLSALIESMDEGESEETEENEDSKDSPTEKSSVSRKMAIAMIRKAARKKKDA